MGDALLLFYIKTQNKSPNFKDDFFSIDKTNNKHFIPFLQDDLLVEHEYRIDHV